MKFKCVQYDWKDVYDLCKVLARKIKGSGFKPDAIVAVARGGWVPARILADLLMVKELYSVKAEHWGIVATVTGKAKITQPLTADLSGKKVLVVDDVADTGETVELVAKHIMERNAKEVRTAVIDFKHTSKFVPDYYAREMEKWAWIVYPWSLYEDVKDLIAKLNCNGMNASEIAKKLAEEFELYVDESIVEEILKDC